MKAILFFALLTAGEKVFAQINTDTTENKAVKLFKITKNDGSFFIGKIISQDAREVLIETDNLGQVMIPKHVISEIKELNEKDFSETGSYIQSEVFSTRYFITTNGLPVEKGESYIQWNLHGPDFQFGVGKNFGLGVMTTWIGVPIIASAKYSVKLTEGAHLGIGTLLGTGSWVKPDYGIALPFGVFTLGDRRANISFSGGYGAVFEKGEAEGRFLCSVAGMLKISKDFALIFDSFIVPSGKLKRVAVIDYDFNGNPITSYKEERSPNLAILIPGIRWQIEPNKAFQFGFSAVIFDSEMLPVPFPMIQWYRKL